jgi:type II secretory pathway pseudopilin PulG
MANFAFRAKPSKRPLIPAAGFTIVEIFIVLAIAGFIMLMVLEAIPTLERNSRNNQRKQDVQTILAAVSHWELNHSGDIPITPGDNFLQYDTSRMSYYDPATEVISTKLTVGASEPGQPTDLDKVYVYNYQKCDPSFPGHSTPNGAGFNDVVAIYAIEAGNATASPQCEQI